MRSTTRMPVTVRQRDDRVEPRRPARRSTPNRAPDARETASAAITAHAGGWAGRAGNA